MAENKSLDSTLKEILEETEAEGAAAPAEPVKPKRTRRTKAQIEEDNRKAAEAAALAAAEAASAESSDEPEAPVEEVPTEEPQGEDTSTNEEPFEEAPVENVQAEETPDLPSPEILEDSEIDTQEDITEPESAPEAEAEPEVEPLEPEVLVDTEQDTLPDIEDQKPQVKPSHVIPSGEAVEAFQEEQPKEDTGSIIGKSIVLTRPTPMYRGAYASENLRLKPYVGQVTFVEEPRAGFVKVKFLRQGFGLCEGFIYDSYVPVQTDDESDE